MHPPRTVPNRDDDALRAARDAYRSSLARSLAAARRHDQFAQRLHAIDSAYALVRLIFGLEGQLPPDVDDLADALHGVEIAQDWPPGYLRFALLHLIRDPAPRHQLEIARRVERLLTSCGIEPPTETDVRQAESTAAGQLISGSSSRAP